MSRRVRVAVEAVVSLAVLAALLLASEPGQIWDEVTSVRPAWLLPAIAVNLATVVLMALRWQLLLRAKGVDPGLAWLTRTYLVALFAGQFLPAAVGGDAVRAVELGRRTGDGAEAVASVLIDRLVGLISLVALALVAVAAAGGSVGGTTVILVEAAFGAAAVAGLALLFSSRLRGVVARRLEPRVDGRRLAAGTRFYDALHRYRDHRATLAAVSVLALLVQAARIGVVWLLVRALAIDVTAAELLVAVPVVFAALVLPVSLNGIGVREAIFVWFLGDGDTSTEEAIALGVAFLVVTSATALAGALVLLVRLLRHGAGAVRPRRDIEPAGPR